MEAAIHVPVSFWAVRALVKGDHKVPLVLLAYALQTVITTATCMYDFSQWEGVAVEAKWHLASLYGPYLLIGESILFFSPGGWWELRDALRWLGIMSTNGCSYVYGCGYVGEGEWGLERVEGFEGREEEQLGVLWGVESDYGGFDC
jgi:hypothetical protein